MCILVEDFFPSSPLMFKLAFLLLLSRGGFTIHDLVQVAEALPPLQTDVSVHQLLVSLDVLRSMDLKAILIEKSGHLSIGVGRLVGVIVRGTATAHCPGLVGALGRPGENKLTLFALKSFRKAAHRTLLDQVALLEVNSSEGSIELSSLGVGKRRLFGVHVSTPHFAVGLKAAT